MFGADTHLSVMTGELARIMNTRSCEKLQLLSIQITKTRTTSRSARLAGLQRKYFVAGEFVGPKYKVNLSSRTRKDATWAGKWISVKTGRIMNCTYDFDAQDSVCGGLNCTLKGVGFYTL